MINIEKKWLFALFDREANSVKRETMTSGSRNLMYVHCQVVDSRTVPCSVSLYDNKGASQKHLWAFKSKGSSIFTWGGGGGGGGCGEGGVGWVGVLGKVFDGGVRLRF